MSAAPQFFNKATYSSQLNGVADAIGEAQVSFLETHAFELLRMAGARVFLFGSRARGTQQAFSDVDILVQSNADLSTLIGNFLEKLEESNFPFKVDIVEAKNLATSYRPSVDRDKVEI